MRSGSDFDNFYILGYILCPECRKRGNLEKCKIENIEEWKSGNTSVLVKCFICGYTSAPMFRGITREEFMELYNLI